MVAAPTDALASPSTGPRTTGQYRPHLDGLRCIAVYLVVAFHADWSRLLNGFIGVDVFFVLSGYLVTELLLRDLDGRGSVDLRRFYSRRVRRLLPAALVTIVLSSLVYRLIASPAEVDSAVGTVQAALVYVANWSFIARETDYFASEATSSPVFQFWSLSVEEQFYVIWPLLLAGLYALAGRFGPRRVTVVRAVVAVAACASLGWALALVARGDLARAYYGTDTRAYQLFAGALLALTPGLIRRARSVPLVRLWAPAGVVGVLLLSTPLVSLDAIQRGAVTVVVVLVALVGVESHPDGLVARGLSIAPVTYLGRISYGTYLWHWIVILVADQALDLAPYQLAVMAAVVATGLAALSYDILEQPVRRSALLDRYRRPTIAVGLALSVIGAVVVAPQVLQTDQGTAVVAQGTAVGVQEVPDDLDLKGAAEDKTAFPTCAGMPATRCTLVEGSGAHIMLIGDSHARMPIPMFERVARARDLTFSVGVRPACPWQQDLFLMTNEEGCREGREDTYARAIDQLRPDVVFAAGLALDDPGRPVEFKDGDGVLVQPGEPGGEAYLAETTRASVDALTRLVDQVVLVEPIPLTPTDQKSQLNCLGRARYLEECRFVATDRPLETERTYRRLAAEEEGVSVLDLDRLVCPYFPICDPLVDRLIVRRDATHITGEFSASLGSALAEVLDEQGLL